MQGTSPICGTLPWEGGADGLAETALCQSEMAAAPNQLHHRRLECRDFPTPFATPRAVKQPSVWTDSGLMATLMSSARWVPAVQPTEFDGAKEPLKHLDLASTLLARLSCQAGAFAIDCYFKIPYHSII